MLVKDLITKLAQHDLNTRVVVDLVEGFFTIDEHVVQGGTGHPNYEPVVVISLDEKIREDDPVQIEEIEPELVSVATVITTTSGDEVVVLIDINEEGLLEVRSSGDIKSIYFDSDNSVDEEI